MAARVLRVALTGGIATGKSYCLARFRDLGAETIDADLLAREAVRPGSPGLAAVVSRFGASMLDERGALDRAALGRIVFSDADARRDLEHIVHPFVRAAIAAWTNGLIADSETRIGAATIIAIADIPLLFEQGRRRDFDCVVVAACDPALQRQRLVARGGLTAADADSRIAVQWPIADKRREADWVIETSGTFAQTDAQVAAVWKSLLEMANQASIDPHQVKAKIDTGSL